MTPILSGFFHSSKASQNSPEKSDQKNAPWGSCGGVKDRKSQQKTVLEEGIRCTPSQGVRVFQLRLSMVGYTELFLILRISVYNLL